MTYRLARISLALAALALTSAAGARQQEEPGPEVAFDESVDVRLATVEVWVTDRQGRPVPALLPEDFELVVDGQPTEITHFSTLREPSRGRAVTEIPSDPEPPTDPSTTPGEPPPPVPAAPDSLVIYFDELHLGRLQRKQLVADLRALIESGAVPSDRILVLRQGNRLTAEAAFGSSPAALDEALDRLADPPPGLDAVRDRRWMVTRLWDQWEINRQRTDRDPCEFFVRSAVAEVSAYARSASSRALLTAENLSDTARLLGGLAGSKSLIYVGDALDLTPGLDLLALVRGLCPFDVTETPATIALEELTGPFADVARLANANRVTIHAIAPGGLSPGLLSGVDQRTAQPRIAAPFERALRTGERSGLEALAIPTGGRAIVHRNRFEQELDRIAQELVSHYSLGFTPPGEPGDRYRVEVRTRLRGLTVRHRRELRSTPSAERLESRVLSALHLGEAPNPLDVRLAHGEVFGRDGKLFLPLHLLVPIERLTYGHRGPQGPMASLEIVVEGRGDGPGRELAERKTVRFLQPAEPAGRADLLVEVEIEGGLWVLGVGVRDEISGQVSAVSTTLGIRPPQNRPAG